MAWLYGLDRLHRIGSSEQRLNILAAAVDFGASGFDVAPMYGNGIGEVTLGRFIKRAGASVRSSLRVNTKFGIPYVPYGLGPNVFFKACRVADLAFKKLTKRSGRRDFSVRSLQSSVEESLRRLNTDYIDTLFIHEPLLIPEDAEVLSLAMSRLAAAGKVRTLGVSGEFCCVLEIPQRMRLMVLQAPLVVLASTSQHFGERIAYNLRRGLKVQPGQVLSVADYYAAARSAGAETVLFQSTQLAHLKAFAGA